MLFAFSFTLFKEDIALRLCRWFWLVRGSALGPICGLSARQLNSCLPRREERKNGTSDKHKSTMNNAHTISRISRKLSNILETR